MKIIDNLNSLLGDDLKSEITPGSKVRIAASTFSIFAFESLRKELEQVELDFIFTSPSFVTAKVTDKLRKERREFFIPTAGSGESSLYGSEFEIRLRNKLTQRAIAKECAEWVRRKVRFRSNSTGNPMQQFAVVDDKAAYMPLQGFTTADLKRVRTGQRSLEHGAPHRRHPDDVAVHRPVRPDLEQPGAAR